jgi:hypothetical protein
MKWKVAANGANRMAGNFRRVCPISNRAAMEVTARLYGQAGNTVWALTPRRFRMFYRGKNATHGSVLINAKVWTVIEHFDPITASRANMVDPHN